LAGRLRPDPLGELSPEPLAVIRRGEGGNGKERIGNSRERRKVRGAMEGRAGEWRDGKGRRVMGVREQKGRESGGRVRLGYLSMGPRVTSYATENHCLFSK